MLLYNDLDCIIYTDLDCIIYTDHNGEENHEFPKKGTFW